MQQEWRKNTHRNALTVNERFTFGANGSLSWRKRRKYPRRKFSEAATSQSRQHVSRKRAGAMWTTMRNIEFHDFLYIPKNL